jgi:hypothetical protein
MQGDKAEVKLVPPVPLLETWCLFCRELIKKNG